MAVAFASEGIPSPFCKARLCRIRRALGSHRSAARTDRNHCKKAAAGSSFDTSSRIAVASVRGTIFRFGNTTDGKSKLETLTGQVALGPETHGNPMLVDAGFGSRVDQAGVVEKPTPLPQIPRVIAPLGERFPKMNPCRLDCGSFCGVLSRGIGARSGLWWKHQRPKYRSPGSTCHRVLPSENGSGESRL